MFCSSSSCESATMAKSFAGMPLRWGLSPYRPKAMPHRPALRAESTMPRQMRAARFFWKMLRYTTSQVKCAIPSSSNERRCFLSLTCGPGRLVGPYLAPGEEGCQGQTGPGLGGSAAAVAPGVGRHLHAVAADRHRAPAAAAGAGGVAEVEDAARVRAL